MLPIFSIFPLWSRPKSPVDIYICTFLSSESKHDRPRGKPSFLGQADKTLPLPAGYGADQAADAICHVGRPLFMQANAGHILQARVAQRQVEGLEHLQAPPQLLDDEMSAQRNHLLGIHLEEAEAKIGHDVEGVRAGETVLGSDAALEQRDNLVGGNADEQRARRRGPAVGSCQNPREFRERGFVDPHHAVQSGEVRVHLRVEVFDDFVTRRDAAAAAVGRLLQLGDGRG